MQLTEYLDGALPSEVQAGFDAHVASCPTCAPLVKSVRGMVTAMQGMEMLPVPPRLTTVILEKTSGVAAATPSSWRTWFGWTKFVIAPRFAYGVLTVFITLIVLSQALGPRVHRPTIADLSPVNLYRQANRQAHLLYARSSKFVADLRVVIEIQSRLSPGNEAQPAQEAPASSSPANGGHSENDRGTPRHENRAASSPFRMTQVASALIFDTPARRAP
jgi:anti-sigma factor RsiW